MRCLLIAASLVACPALLTAAEKTGPDFSTQIRPILAQHCFACHGADEESRAADLRLDLRADAIDYGAIVAGDSKNSTIVERIFSHEEDVVMPPPKLKKPLSAAQKQLLVEWVDAGAEYQDHWAFVAPKSVVIPSVQSQPWSHNAIDRFVMSRLQDAGLNPAEEVDSRVLFRRLHLDITGLPPTVPQTDLFQQEYAGNPEATLSAWIDRLMATSAWGEHRGRYWLDAARYGDTHGLHFDNYREMWPYRDWVIRSFNRNQPFDEFTVEQIAGDLLPNPSTNQRIATGFQRCNITTNEGGTIDEENLANYAIDRVQTLGWVYLGLTTNCAQCHDHKFDPISHEDYYSLSAYFRNTTQKPKDGNSKDGRGPVLKVPRPEDQKRWHALPTEIAVAKKQQNQYRNQAQSAFQNWLKTVKPEDIQTSVASQGLQLHIPFDESSGNEIRSEGTLTTAVKPVGKVNWIPDGKVGKSVKLSNGNTFTVAKAGNFQATDSFTCATWVKTQNSASVAILAKMDVANNYRGWDLWQQGRSVGIHIIDQWSGNAMKLVTEAGVLSQKKWVHVAVTYDGSAQPDGVRIYVNGKHVSTRIETNTLKPGANIRNDEPLKIGQRSNSAVFENGSVQDVRLYDRKLSESDISLIASGTLVSVADYLAIEDNQRTKAQNDALLNYYLMQQDDQYVALTRNVEDLQDEQQAIDDRSAITHIQEEKPNSMAMAYVLARGEYDRPGEQVAARPIAALHPLPEGAPANRLGLAKWLIDPANPLTARVTVNRFWQEIFGQGIVTTTEDFGVMGALPSHPKLLDWMATDFIQSGWNVKRFYKQIFMSRTYRQAAQVTALKLEKDRDNQLLSRGPRFRMDAEMVRDYALSTSGLLKDKMYGPGVKPYQPSDIWNIVGLPGGDTRNYVKSVGDDLYRRSLYTFWKRMAPNPTLETFNAPSREVCVVRRERTNTPLQALVTLNDPTFVEAARNLAAKAMDVASSSSLIADHMAEKVLFRQLSDAERKIIGDQQRKFEVHYEANPKDAAALIAVGDSPVRDHHDPIQLAAWTMVGNQLMNLDEVLCK
ncbi:MAG: DUF1553 domain-containing protein [Fuerstiella sp.]